MAGTQPASFSPPKPARAPSASRPQKALSLLHHFPNRRGSLQLSSPASISTLNLRLDRLSAGCSTTAPHPILSSRRHHPHPRPPPPPRNPPDSACCPTPGQPNPSAAMSGTAEGAHANAGGGFDLLRRATQAMMSNGLAAKPFLPRTSLPFQAIHGARWLCTALGGGLLGSPPIRERAADDPVGTASQRVIPMAGPLTLPFQWLLRPLVSRASSRGPPDGKRPLAASCAVAWRAALQDRAPYRRRPQASTDAQPPT
ncbi:Uncharacterized protein TPAR_09040 [Tolypocladium paradoxum]|uniref:Uncharacterized protein n=1 Tax=Tolypocladium paradoxum TaxID=94208 RepID=A0A2S4KSR6_9HYPO|nr:Uncharacterized protein TPAR_09040 [Tolypocladium paradoxum]